jgi:tetratricopeptide (TPR) repeat protein
VLAFEKAEQHSEATWGVTYGLSRAHQQLKDFRAALKYIDKFKSLSNQFLDTDNDYKEARWTMLLAEGNCRRQCQDYTLAAQCFRDILDHDVGDQSWVHSDALTGLFTTWNENKDYQLLIDHMRSWRDAEDKERGPTFWLQKTTQTDRIHGCIIAAAKHTEALEDVCSLYQGAIDEITKLTTAVGWQRDESLIDAKAQLQYFQAALRFHGSQSPYDHDRGIQSWEEMIRKCDDAASSRWKAYDASRKLAPSLLDKAVEEALLASPGLSETYSSRLEALARMNNAVIRNERQSQRDPRLCLMRLYHLRGKQDSAFLEAQTRLCSVFDGWPKDIGDDSLPLRFQNLAQTLTVLDKDFDAVAAWQATDPQNSQQITTPSNTAQPTDTGSGLVQSDPPSVEGVNAAENHRDASISFEATPIAYVAGFYCDGECGTRWKDMLADCWVCKYCLCVQLCSGCYRKLQADDLDPLICNKSHKHLYLPPFDQAMWRSVSPDMIIADKQPVPRLQWLNKIRDEYGVQQEQIDMLKIEKARELKAATCIAMHYLKWRRKHLKTKVKKDPAIPILRRARTVV